MIFYVGKDVAYLRFARINQPRTSLNNNTTILFARNSVRSGEFRAVVPTQGNSTEAKILVTVL